MYKNTLLAFDSLYNGASFCAMLCDENFTIIRYNKYAAVNFKKLMEENQLVKYFMSPNRYMAVIKLREQDSFDAVLRFPDKSLYTARVCKLGGYSSHSTVTLVPLAENNNGAEKFVYGQNTGEIISKRFIRSLSDTFEASVKIKENLSGESLTKNGEGLNKLSIELRRLLCSCCNIKIYRDILTNNVKNDIKRMNINHFLNLIFQEASEFLNKFGINFTFSIALNDIISYVDPALLVLAAENIMDNACKYHAPGTKIKAKLSEKDDCYIITVQNKGELIERSVTRRVFEPFCSFDKDPDKSGLGLGLTVTKMLAELYGGECKFSSTLKYGNVCIIKIPIVDKINSGADIVSEQDPFIHSKSRSEFKSYLKSLYTQL